MTTISKTLDSPLGKSTEYISQYAPHLLFSIPRQEGRQVLDIPITLPFHGTDVWTGYELSWINTKGKPIVSLVHFYIPCESKYLIESKSFKLYLNSFNQTVFQSTEEVKQVLEEDLSQAAQATVKVELEPLEQAYQSLFPFPPGICLDHLDIAIDYYEINPSYLSINAHPTEETLYSHLLKSNCPVTGQPDWATVFVHYIGQQIDHNGLLKYIVSFRNHQGFHEQCVEKMYCDIMKYCQPEKLTIYARYTRRGGLDINPFRSNFEMPAGNMRLIRQ